MSRYVIIIGAAKSGTSTLFRHLGSHDRVNTSAGKEPHYFCDGFYERHLSKGTAYEDLWDDECGDVYLEASTGYTKHPVITGAVKNMMRYGLAPKLIYLVREPIERMLSHAKYMMWRRNEPDLDNLGKLCVTTSMYHRQVSRYVRTFGHEKMKVIPLRKLSKQTTNTVNAVFRFIGLEPAPIERGEVENETRKVTNIELALQGTPLWSLKSFIPNDAKRRIRRFWNLFSQSPEAKVVERIEKQNIQEMCKDAQRLKELFEIDLDPWRERFERSELIDGEHS
jgi:sulfur relay (sulfurtransferase) DsrC/TusE family protein